MQTQFIFRIVLAVLVIEYAHANAEYSRGDFTYRLLNNANNNTSIDSQGIETILKRAGLSLDESSQYFVHEEEGYINFDCFNCVLTDIDHNEDIQQSFNMRLQLEK